MSYAILFLASLWAGAQNALAGGGSFVTLSALVLTGIDPRAANITSTIALFPGQVTSGLAGRRFVSGAEGLPFWVLVVISLAGGVLGALLLLASSPTFFAKLVPWLVLFATCVFAFGSRLRPAGGERRLGPRAAGAVQLLISIYGGYFGGGIGFLMLAALTTAGLEIRRAGATKNMLAGVMNASAVLVFLFSSEVYWKQAATVCFAAIAGGLAGAWALRRVDERLLRGVVMAIGVALTVGLFWRAYG
jgi:uncharacterized membrane protein YfcA